MSTVRLGKVQTAIMRVLWEHGSVTARDITEALNKISPIAHSTVQTLLRKLEVKGAVGHEVRERTFYFHATVDPERVRKPATREFIDRVFEGSPSALVAYLLKHERINRDELDRIRSLIDESKQKSKEKKK